VDGSSGSYPFESDGKILKRTIGRIKRVTSNPCTGGGSWLPSAVKRLAQMRSMSGRKFLVFFTDFETDRACPPGWLLRSGNSPWMLFRESLDANVAIYPIDTRASVSVVPFGSASTQAYFGPDLGTISSGNLGGIGRSTILAQESESLSEIASETGGRALVGNRDLFLAFQSIREDSACYELGYYLPDLQADSKFHSITIKLNVPGMSVLTREGYFAPAR
jgi:VWFA-related protein